MFRIHDTTTALALLLVACILSGCSQPPEAVSDAAADGVPASTPHTVEFRRDILPILSSHCFTCHGPDESARKRGLRLDLREHAVKPTRSGVVPIHPGDPGASEVYRRIHADGDERMPPAGHHAPLSGAEKELLTRWIAEGAEYQPHWALVAPQRPALPSVQRRDWIRNEIDTFVLARLEQAGIAPSSPAEREAIIRRVSLDLRGLPPTVHEIDEFLADVDTNAYEKLVDRMLDSPHYGEKMAQTWLDLARFGDTSGYHQDSTRQMWLWRDYVIDAFNRNMPFDRFTIEQLAGDLLPHPTQAQRIASGFNRNTRFNEEGGVDPEEYVVRYNVDRTNTLGQVWLGLTLECAECHSHKYDPITQKEYYQLLAFFTGIKEPMVSMNHNQPLPPLLKVPSAEQEQTLDKLRAEQAEIEAGIQRALTRASYEDPLYGRPELARHKDADAGVSQLAWELRARGDDKLPAEVKAVIAVDRVNRLDSQKKLLRDYYLRHIHAGSRDTFATYDEELADVAKKIRAVEEAIPYSLVSEEMNPPRPTHVLLRGDFQRKGEPVSRDVPAVLPPLPPGSPRNRLGLARWLVAPEHPLTARVTVNRLWAQMFGSGLVRSMGDFGTQGDAPSHPELLDWLAIEFVRTGWDTKAILRKIATSNTYRQASTYRTEPRDPDNRLLYRAPRYRLSAEEIRDSALRSAGLLSEKVGGPSVMPYQPGDFYKGKYDTWPWTPSRGADQYRRGIYTFWRRTSLHPMFAIFDAPGREVCTVARPRTNTPLQALVTLNDPSFVEAARVFGQRILLEGPADVEGRIVFAFRGALGRRPTSAERAALEARYHEAWERYGHDADAASKLISVGASPRPAQLDPAEHAAWTSIAQVLLNLDEAIMRE